MVGTNFSNKKIVKIISQGRAKYRRRRINIFFKRRPPTGSVKILFCYMRIPCLKLKSNNWKLEKLLWITQSKWKILYNKCKKTIWRSTKRINLQRKVRKTRNKRNKRNRKKRKRNIKKTNKGKYNKNQEEKDLLLQVHRSQGLVHLSPGLDPRNLRLRNFIRTTWRKSLDLF